MKTLLSIFVLALALLLCVHHAHAGPQADSTFAIVELLADAIDSTVAQDSVEASTPILVPFQCDIERVSSELRLPPALSAAIIQTESRFGQWATRTEPHYKGKRVVKAGAIVWSRKHAGIPTAATEIDDRSRSYGLTQIMGQTAREEGFSYQFLAKLYLSEENIRAGLTHFKLLLQRYKGDTLAAISAYNQGNARKDKRGHFQNAGYVYRVSLAWAAYDRAFKHSKGLIHENRLEQDPRGSNRNSGVLDRAEALPKRSNNDTEHSASPVAYSAGHNDRHDPPRIGPPSSPSDEPLRRTDPSRYNEGLFFVILAAVALSAVGLGLGYGFSDHRWFRGDRKGLVAPQLRPSDRFVLAKSDAQPSRPASTAYTRRIRLRDRAKRFAHLARRRPDGA